MNVLPDLRNASLSWVQFCLSEVTSQAPADLFDRAEALLAIAEENSLSVEHLVQWIYTPAPDKQWSAVELRSFAERYRRENEELRQVS